MGAIVSYVFGPSLPLDYDIPEPILGVSKRDIHNLKTTWDIILKKNTMDAGIRLYEIYFGTYPEHKVYFPTFNDPTTEDLKSNKMVRAHVSNVMSAFYNIIDTLDEPDVLEENLLKIGRNHAPREISRKAFQDFKEALLEWLPKELGPQWTDEMRLTWTRTIDSIWTTIFKTMKKK